MHILLATLFHDCDIKYTCIIIKTKSWNTMTHWNITTAKLRCRRSLGHASMCTCMILIIFTSNWSSLLNLPIKKLMQWYIYPCKSYPGQNRILSFQRLVSQSPWSSSVPHHCSTLSLHMAWTSRIPHFCSGINVLQKLRVPFSQKRLKMSKQGEPQKNVPLRYHIRSNYSNILIAWMVSLSNLFFSNSSNILNFKFSPTLINWMAMR